MHRPLVSGPLVWLGIIVTTCLLLVLFQTVLWLVLPLFMAVVANYILSPLVHIAMARGLSRARAVMVVTVMLTLFLAAVGLIVMPKISHAAHNSDEKLQEYVTAGKRLISDAKDTLIRYHVPFVSRTLSDHVGVVGMNVPPPVDDGDFSREVTAFFNKHAPELLHWIPSLLLVPYMTYFFLLDGPRFKRFLIQAIPNAFFEKTLYLFFRVEDQLRRYFQGMLALSALDAFFLGVGFWFVGLSSPFFLAVVAAVMAWLPYLGSIGGGVLVVLVAAHDFPDNYWLPYQVVAIFVVVRLLDDFVFMPLTVGRSLEMHPLITVLMILMGGAVAGISGLLLVMPVLGVVMVAGQIVGELLTDQRILARHRHALELSRRRARLGL